MDLDKLVTFSLKINVGDLNGAYYFLLIFVGGGTHIQRWIRCSYMDLQKMDPKQAFPPTKKHTFNKYFCLFLIP